MNAKLHASILALALLTLAGCATKPQNIAPAYYSEMGFINYTCEQLAQEQMRLVAALTAESAAQRQARANDTLGVIFLGLPVSSLAGNNRAAEIARLKGELEAVRKAGILKNCNLPLVVDPTQPKTAADTSPAKKTPEGGT